MENALFNALIKEAKAKDERAIGILYNYCIKILQVHLSAKFNNKSEVEDWAHDIFTYRILTYLPDYEVEHHVAWLNKIADNYVCTFYNKTPPTVELGESIYADENFNAIVDGMLLDAAFKGVGKDVCRILVLKYFYGYQYTEIAKLLGIKADAVRQRVSRAKKNFNKYRHVLGLK